MDEYAIYLRKSRADLEAEAHGEGETLARHEAALTRLAAQRGLSVVRTYREIVSGDTISARPEMQNLLSAVRTGIYAGVIVMEVERLARGNTKDQGIVAEAFALTGTKIITPGKIYDPTNEYDMEYFEFGLFMARREYKTIVRRMQAGRAASAREGLFPGGTAPFGYRKVKLQGRKGFTLEHDEREAPIVRLIGDLYAYDMKDGSGRTVSMGGTRIARYLNGLGHTTRSGRPWTASSVREVLTNDANYGRVRWQHRKEVKRLDADGNIVVSRPVNREEAIVARAIFEPLFSEEVQRLIEQKLGSRDKMPTPWGKETQNPLVGLVVCGFCDHKMLRLPSPRIPPALICTTIDCPCVSSYVHLVEKRILTLLQAWLFQHEVQIHSPHKRKDACGRIRALDAAAASLEKELGTLRQQHSRLQDLLEQGVYDAETYFNRAHQLSERRKAKKEELSRVQSEIRELRLQAEQEENFVPRVRNVLELYGCAETPADKNRLLKSILAKVVYSRSEGGRWAPSDNFMLTLYPRLPSSRPLLITPPG